MRPGASRTTINVMDETARTPIWRRDPVLDWAIPLVLLVPAWLSLWGVPKLMASGEVHVPPGAQGSAEIIVTGLSYVLVAMVFVPLVFRRKFPLTALTLTTVMSAVYLATSNPRAPVQLAPIVALYMVGTLRDRRTVWMAYTAVTVFTLALTVHPFTGVAWIPDAVSTVTAFGVAAALGDATRSRRAYVAAVEQRAIDAERTREDEALRRVEEERLRIARELHDVTAHSLSIIALQAGAAEKAVRRDPDSAIAALHTIRITSKDSLDELRSSPPRRGRLNSCSPSRRRPPWRRECAFWT